MKLMNKTTVQSNFGSGEDTQKMVMDEDAMPHIMSILSDMYADKELAVLREYSANALDSHKEAGVSDPIEVSLPNWSDHTVRIRDYGIGLSRDEIITVYSVYGKSTKRDTNSQIGSFGIGAKSAFAISNQFTVTGVKNGWKTAVLFSLGEDGSGECTIVSHDRTDEPNGVLVEVPVKSVMSMITAAKIFEYWDKGTVLVDGKEPEYAFDDLAVLCDGLAYVSRKSWDQHSASGGSLRAVMGNIVYTVTPSLLSKVRTNLSRDASSIVDHYINSAKSIFIPVEIGSVDITPSRESLSDTKRVVALLTDKLNNLGATFLQDIQKQIDGCADITGAAQIWVSFKEILRSESMTWNGAKYPGVISLPSPSRIFKYTKSEGTRDTNYGSLNLRYFADSNVVVVQVDDYNRRALVRSKLYDFARARNLEDKSRIVLFTPSKHWEENHNSDGYWLNPTYYGDNWLNSIVLEEEVKQYRKSARNSSGPSTRAEPTYTVQYYRTVNGESERVVEIVPVKTIKDHVSKLPGDLVIADTANNHSYFTNAILVVLSGAQQYDVAVRRLSGDRRSVTSQSEYYSSKAAEAVDNLPDEAVLYAHTEDAFGFIKYLRFMENKWYDDGSGKASPIQEQYNKLIVGRDAIDAKGVMVSDVVSRRKIAKKPPYLLEMLPLLAVNLYSSSAITQQHRIKYVNMIEKEMMDQLKEEK